MIHTPGESFEARESVAVSVQADTASVTIPDAHLLFTADFKRKGSDLVLTGDDGHKILVSDYFRHEKQPDLVSPEGALLSASLVELLSGSAAPGQYAQAAAPAAQQPIGRVETVSGSATVTRNGVAVDLNVGDLVFQGDVVQTRSDSTLGIGFSDGSAFSLKENARMALNEFVYDPNGTSNSALINLVQGTVSFIASQVAKTGNMRVDTPTATLGIRGTFVTVDVSSVDGHTVASLGLETNLTTGEQFAGAFTLTNRITGNQVNVNSVNSMFSVSRAGTISESTKPPAIAAIEQASFQALSAIAAATAAGMGTGPTGPTQYLNDPNSPSGTKPGDTGPGSGPAPGGSGGANTAPTNTSPNDNHPTTTTSTTTHVDTPPANTGPTNIPNNTNQTNTPLALNQTNALPVSDIKPTVAPTDTTKTTTIDNHHDGSVTQPGTTTGLTPTLSVTISGTAQEGQTLRANATTNDSDTTIHYQWQSSSDNGHTWSNISGATDRFYLVAESDETHLLRVIATTSDPVNSSTATATSTPTSAVIDVTPTLTVPFSFKVDELTIVKNSNQIYDNNFDQAPPLSPNIDGHTPIEFIVSGAWTESSGKAVMSSSNAVPLLVNDGVAAILNTNTQSTSDLGLKLNAAFTVSAKFDLSNPANTTGYGLGLTDGTSMHSSDEVVEIVVQKVNGNVVVGLFQADFTAENPFTLLASQTITSTQLTGNDQIQLQLDHAVNSTAITGSFQLLSGGYVTGTTTFLGTGQQGTIFTNGVTWTRAELFSFATPTTVTISGTAKEGQTLTANAATNDADATIHYQWQKSSDNFLHATNIGTDSSTYVVQEADEGFKIRVVASTSDRDNSSTASATSNATSPVTDITLAFTSAASISGTAQEGQTLTAVNGTLNDADAAVTSYQWQELISGTWTNIFGATSQTYLVTEANEGHQIRVKETADGDGGPSVTSTSAATNTVTDITLAFTSTASIDNTSPKEGDTLTAVNGTLNDSDAAVTGYQWQELISGIWTNISGATSQTYVVTGANETHQLRVVETATDSDGGPTVTSTSAATSAVADITLAFTSAASINNTSPKEGDTLTAVSGTLNDGDAAVTGYQWQELISGTWTNISGATSQTYVVTEANETHQIRVVKTATDSDGGPSVTSISAATAAVTDITLALSGVSISGTAQEGQTLTANGTVNDSDATISYQWQKSTDGFAHFTIIGSNSATYLVQGADEGSQIRVVETASDTDNGGFTTSVTSDATAAVIDETPSITVSISGTPQADHTLHAVVSGFEDDDTLTYQWQSSSDGGHTWSNITDATSACYQVQEGDEGHQLQIVVTDTTEDNSGTATASAATYVGMQADDWNTAASGSWGTAANWSNGVPTSSVDALINATGANYTVSLVSGAVAHSLVINSSNATVAGGSDESLTITGALTVDAGSISLSGGTIQAGSIDLESAATLVGFGNVSGPITNSGLIEAQSSHTLAISGNISGTGSIEVLNHSTLEVDGSVASTQTLSFAGGNGVTGTLVLDHSLTQSFSAVISGLGLNDYIDLKDFTFTSGHMTASTSYANGDTTLVVSNTSTEQSVSLTLAGNYTSSTWNFAQDSGTGTIFHDPPATDADAATVPGSASTDLAQTVTAALNMQGATLDQFAFQADSHSGGTIAANSTLTASGENANTTDAATLDPISSASSDQQPAATVTADGSAVNGLASNVATAPQPATTDATSSTQAGATTQTASAPSTASAAPATPAATGPNGDTFVFAANFGHETIASFHPDTDVIEIDHTVFADFQALLAATHDDGHGNAVIAANPNDTITVKNVTVAQLVQHQSDFHFT